MWWSTRSGRLTDEHDDLPEGTRAGRSAPARPGRRVRRGHAPQARQAALRGGVPRLPTRPRGASRARGGLPGAGPTSRRTTTATAPSTAGSGCPLHAEILKKALQSLTSPRRLGEAARPGDREEARLHAARPGSWSCWRATWRSTTPDPGRWPVHHRGHHRPRPAAVGDRRAASTPARISAREARRLACRAGLIPMVLDGDSVPLDLGRERRLFSKAQRIALAHRYGGCAAVNCDRPPAWTEAHHLDQWHQGGRTDLRADPALPAAPPHGRPPGLVEHEADAPRRGPVQGANRRARAAGSPCSEPRPCSERARAARCRHARASARAALRPQRGNLRAAAPPHSSSNS